MIDAETELKVFENAIRDLLIFVLGNKFGSNWENRLSISTDRVSKWRIRQEDESKRLRGFNLDSRLIYYSDFYDLKSVIDKHWDDGFKDVFKEKKEILVFLETLEKFRDPNAHRRELIDYQKHLIVGISGYIRGIMMQYRGKRENPDDFFPVIDSVSDSLGNQVSNPNYAHHIASKVIVHVGDEVEITGYSIDPCGGTIEYSIARICQKNWSESNRGIIKFTESDIGRCCDIQIMIRTTRSYHAYSDFDHYVQIRYVVLP